MSSGKGRLDLDRKAQAAAEAETRALHEAADRVELWLSKVEAARQQAFDDPDAEDEAPPLAAPAKRGFWPFGKKKDPVEARTRTIMADLEAVSHGRPLAGADQAAGRKPGEAKTVAAPPPQVRRVND
jgi:hypothetical protein